MILTYLGNKPWPFHRTLDIRGVNGGLSDAVARILGVKNGPNIRVREIAVINVCNL